MSSLYKSLQSIKVKCEGDLAKAQAALDSAVPGSDGAIVARFAVEAERAKLASLVRAFDTILLDAGIGALFKAYVDGAMTLKEAADTVAARLIDLNS